jgi:hypothetical protein
MRVEHVTADACQDQSRGDEQALADGDANAQACEGDGEDQPGPSAPVLAWTARAARSECLGESGVVAAHLGFDVTQVFVVEAGHGSSFPRLMPGRGGRRSLRRVGGVMAVSPSVEAS